MEFYDRNMNDRVVLVYEITFTVGFASVQIVEIYYIGTITSTLVKQVG